MFKRLFALLAMLGIVIAVVVGRKRSQTPTVATNDFRHPDRSVSWLAAVDSMVDRKIGWYRLPLPLGIQVNIDRCFHVGYSLAVNNNSVCE